MNKSKINLLIAGSNVYETQLLVSVLLEIIPEFTYAIAENGIECITNLKNKNKPDIVFLDLHLPLKNGIECLKDIDHQELLRDTPIIIHSFSHNRKDVDAAYAYGARAFLVNPNSFSKLFQLVKVVFKKLGEPLKQQFDRAHFVIWERRLKLSSSIMDGTTHLSIRRHRNMDLN